MKAELLLLGRPALLTAFSLPGYGGNSGRGGGGNNYSGGASYNTGSHGGYGGGSGGGGSSYQGKQGQYTTLPYISFHARAASSHPCVLLPGSGSQMGGKVPILRRNSFLLLFHALMVTECFSLPFSTPPPPPQVDIPLSPTTTPPVQAKITAAPPAPTKHPKAATAETTTA